MVRENSPIGESSLSRKVPEHQSGTGYWHPPIRESVLPRSVNHTNSSTVDDDTYTASENPLSEIGEWKKLCDIRKYLNCRCSLLPIRWV